MPNKNANAGALFASSGQPIDRLQPHLDREVLPIGDHHVSSGRALTHDAIQQLRRQVGQ